MVSELLRSLIGHRVKVFSNGSHTDEGIVESVDHVVIVLRDGSHVKVFPLTAVRLIKPVR